MKSQPIQTTPTIVSDKVKSLFQNMSSQESIAFQLDQWVLGTSMHNPVRDECCPDFSCCDPKGKMDKDLRIKFSNAVKMKDEETKMKILGMALSGITSEMGVDVHIVGEDDTVH